MGKSKTYIDCQFFQTEVWDRGMGRYAMSLLTTMYSKSTNTEYFLIFSENLPINNAAVEAFSTMCPTAIAIYLNLLTTHKTNFVKASAHNKLVLDEYISKASHRTDDSIRPTFFIPCLFQEPTASVFPDSVKKCLLYYDAIPLLYFDRYRNAINYEGYLDRYKVLHEADIIFTISQTIADDLSIYLGVTDSDHRSVINIDGACNDEMFKQAKKPSISLDSGYILLPSSNDIRKNNYIAIKAFNQFQGLAQKKYKLVITSTFSKEMQDQLSALSPDVVFTGNISENELAWLYQNAEVVLFASEYEGLGLPVLEAVKAGKRVACSNIPVFREISEGAFYFFNPLDVEEVALALHDAAIGTDWSLKLTSYPDINAKYQWSHSAELVMDSIFSLKDQDYTTIKKNLPKIAILAPTPDGYSAIGKVVQELHEEMSRYFDIDYYFEDKKSESQIAVRPNYLVANANCFSVSSFNARVYRKYNAVLYHIGNSEYHFNTILNALHLPGVAIFHDTFLHDAFGEMVRLNYISAERFNAEAALDAIDAPLSPKSSFITAIANNQIARIVHSRYASDVLSSVLCNKSSKTFRAELPVVVPGRTVLSQKRKKVHIGLAGVLTGNKGLDIIKSIALDEMIASEVVIHVFGFNFVDPTIIDELSAYKNVNLMTNLSDFEYQTQLSNLDILVNYRTSYRGETSLTVLEAMRYGCTVIVNGRLGWFSELPDDAVLKVDDRSDILSSVRRLVLAKDNRIAIGSAARKYIRAVHAPSKYVLVLNQAISDNSESYQYQKSSILKEADNLKDAEQMIKGIKA